MGQKTTNTIYENAPVIEAVIDIHVEMGSEFSQECLDGLAEKLSDRFPIKNKMSHIRFGLEFTQDGLPKTLPQTAPTQEDYRLDNADNSRVLQIRKIGFAYSHLPKYTNWGKFSEEAKELWAEFIKATKPKLVTRCAIRFINRFDLPKAPVEIEEYLNIFPQFPKTIPQLITGMQMRLVMPQPDIGAEAIINEVLLDSIEPGGVSFVLDVDIFKMLSVMPESVDVWETIEKIRSRKNELFEAFITDKTRELIE